MAAAMAAAMAASMAAVMAAAMAAAHLDLLHTDFTIVIGIERPAASNESHAALRTWETPCLTSQPQPLPLAMVAVSSSAQAHP